jgi:hypothetical protein
VFRVRDLPYWALMCLLAALRFVICWFFLVFSLCALSVLAEQIRESPMLFFDRGKAFLATTAITNGVAWWKTLRNSPTHREWAIAACLFMLLCVGFDVVIRQNPADLFRQYWPIGLIGAVGLVAYLPPWRLRPVMEISAYRRKSPEQDRRGALVWLLAVGRFVATWAYCLVSVASLFVAKDDLRESSMQFTSEIACATFVALLSGAAWWTTMHNRPGQRIWAIATSLVYLSTLAPILILNPTALHPRYAAWAVLLTAAIGLVSYLVPYRLRYSVDLSSYRLKSPDQALKHIHATL